MALAHRELTEQIIGAAIEVHRRLGPGFLESIYENALVIELRKRGISVEKQVEVPVFYDGLEVGLHRLDLLVGGIIIVELKAIKAIEDVHFAVVRSYLSALRLEHGLLFNFARPVLDGKRVFGPRT